MRRATFSAAARLPAGGFRMPMLAARRRRRRSRVVALVATALTAAVC